MRSRRGFCLAIMAAMLGGCAEGVSEPLHYDPSHPTAMEFSKQLVTAASNKLDKALVHGTVTDRGGYSQFFVRFFPINLGEDGIIRSYGNFCGGIGGEESAQEAVDGSRSLTCGRHGDHDDVMFFARIRNVGAIADGTPREELSVYEPKDSPQDESYLAAIRSQGYTTEAEQRAQAQARLAQIRKRAAEERLRQEQAMFARESHLPAIRTRGARICHDDVIRGFAGPQRITLVGYTEDASGERIQIRIVGVDGLSFGGVRENITPSYQGVPLEQNTILWDDPMNWDLCQ